MGSASMHMCVCVCVRTHTHIHTHVRMYSLMLSYIRHSKLFYVFRSILLG
jgi:hypothetical protein